MISKEEYFAVNEEYLGFRKAQVESLIDFLKRHIELKGELFVSVGCGVAADVAVLSDHFTRLIGIDHNPSIIDFCNNVHKNHSFYCDNHMSFLEKQEDGSIDCIFALDIDTNSPPLVLLGLAMKKLRERGYLIITEREYNKIIYRRLLLEPFLDDLVRESGNHISSFGRFNDPAVNDDRDNFIVIFRK
jgi:hypothetical protein